MKDNYDNLPVSDLLKRVTIGNAFKILTLLGALVTGSFLIGFNFGGHSLLKSKTVNRELQEEVLNYQRKDKFLSYYSRFLADEENDEKREVLDAYILELSKEVQDGARYVKIGRGLNETRVTFFDGSVWEVPEQFETHISAVGDPAMRSLDREATKEAISAAASAVKNATEEPEKSDDNSE